MCSAFSFIALISVPTLPLWNPRFWRQCREVFVGSRAGGDRTGGWSVGNERREMEMRLLRHRRDPSAVADATASSGITVYGAARYSRMLIFTPLILLPLLLLLSPPINPVWTFSSVLPESSSKNYLSTPKYAKHLPPDAPEISTVPYYLHWPTEGLWRMWRKTLVPETTIRW